MPKQSPENHTPHRPIRVEDDLWEAFGRQVGRRRSQVVRDFIAWHTHQPDAAMPKRPPAPPKDAPPAS
ncbi:hypothetical protein ACIBSV_46935 [Embleya sp. NPDC050154]|uniref:hypothetical protein n=1 Tax=Embleya sp. NPDC050154 TaxID=3363988 RepID=UPI0037A2B0EC